MICVASGLALQKGRTGSARETLAVNFVPVFYARQLSSFCSTPELHNFHVYRTRILRKHLTYRVWFKPAYRLYCLRFYRDCTPSSGGCPRNTLKLANISSLISSYLSFVSHCHSILLHLSSRAENALLNTQEGSQTRAGNSVTVYQSAYPSIQQDFNLQVTYGLNARDPPLELSIFSER